MNTKNDPAFPVGESWLDALGSSHKKGALYNGLSKKEWFAGMALSSLADSNHWRNRDDLASLCFNLAEAMMAESEKRK